MKKCPSCSALNSDTDDICGVCGADLSETAPTIMDESGKVTILPPSVEKTLDTKVGVLHECPYCHKHFAAELVSKENASGAELPASDFPNPRPATTGIASGLRPVTEVFVTFKLNYRCKHCGEEWSTPSTEELSEE